jgi:protein kinase C substrate 80K-H
LKARDVLLTEAKRARKEVEDSIVNLKTLLQSDEIKIKAAEKELVEIEKQDKLRVVKAPKKGGKLSMLVSLTKNRITELKASLKTIKGRKAQADDRVLMLEDILSQMKDTYNPNFNDAGVKAAVRAWEVYAGSGKLPPADTHFDNEVESRLKDEEEHGIFWEEFEEEQTDDVSLCKLFYVSVDPH